MRSVQLDNQFPFSLLCESIVIKNRPLVKIGYPKNGFLISQPKHMLWVLKRLSQ